MRGVVAVDIAKSVFLGVLQGLTEFLPVSSSGHLAIAQELLPGRVTFALAFDVLLHVGTLVSVLIYFRQDLIAMARALLGQGASAAAIRAERRLVLLLAVATVPIGIIGLAFAAEVESAFHSITVVGFDLLFTGFALWFASRHDQGDLSSTKISYAKSAAVGVFQACAVMPGVSRSGMTLVGALICGMERAAAARFAFLLAIPAIAGATLHSVNDIAQLSDQAPAAVVAGTVAAAITGVFAIDLMMRVVRRGRLFPFAVYCWAAGSLALVLSGLNGL